MSSPITIVEGVFPPDGLVVRGANEVDLAAILTSLVGSVVDISIHHFPPIMDTTRAGGGSCLWHGHCPHGHRERPGWLFNQTAKGVLEQDGVGWKVGGTPLDFSKMPGHHGRVVVCNESAFGSGPSEDTSVEDLLSEASEMLGFLESLKDVVKE